MELRSIHPISWDDDTLPIMASFLAHSALKCISAEDGLLMWNNRGMLGIVPPEILTNAIQLHQHWVDAHSQDYPPTVVIAWSQTIPIQRCTLEVLQKPEHPQQVTSQETSPEGNPD